MERLALTEQVDFRPPPTRLLTSRTRTTHRLFCLAALSVAAVVLLVVVALVLGVRRRPEC